MKYSLIFSVAMAVLAVSACEKKTVVVPAATQSAPPGGTGLSGSISAPISTAPGTPIDSSLPSVKPVTPADLPTGSQSKPNPQGSMSSQEESMSMPKPGQADDHSTSVLHPPSK